MKKLAVYTGLFTDDPNKLYGDIIHYTHDKDNVDYIAFTNSDHLKSDFWDIRKIDTWRNGRWTARKCKTSPQELLPDYDAWLWMDNQLFFTYDARSLINHYLEDADLSAHKHCDRNCLYEETQAALGRQPKRDEPETLINQAEQYNKERYPQNIGLFENGILFRRNNEATNKFNKLWFEETAKWNTEDQISMMYSLWKTPEVRVNPIEKTFVEHNYKNKHLSLTDQFGCQSRKVRNVG